MLPQMAGGGGKLVVMVAEKPSICNSIAHALCGGAELSTRGTSKGPMGRIWGRGGLFQGSFESFGRQYLVAYKTPKEKLKKSQEYSSYSRFRGETGGQTNRRMGRHEG